MGTITIKDGTEIYYPGNLYLDCLGRFLPIFGCEQRMRRLGARSYSGKALAAA